MKCKNIWICQLNVCEKLSTDPDAEDMFKMEFEELLKVITKHQIFYAD